MPRPPQRGQTCGAAARLGARAVAGRAALELRDRDRDLGPVHRLVEGQPHLGLQVGAADGCAAAPCRGRRRWRRCRRCRRLNPPAAAERAPAAEAREHAAGVVLLALLGVRERVVGLLDRLEAVLGLRVVGVAVGMVLAGQLAVGLLDLLRGGVPGDPEHVVEVLGQSVSYSLTTTRAARITWPSSRYPFSTTSSTTPGVGALGGTGRDRLVPFGVELLARGLVRLDPRPLQGLAQVAVGQHHALLEGPFD